MSLLPSSPRTSCGGDVRHAFARAARFVSKRRKLATKRPRSHRIEEPGERRIVKPVERYRQVVALLRNGHEFEAERERCISSGNPHVAGADRDRVRDLEM